MLNGVPSILSPELLKIMMEMGHGDELVIGDGNFPAASMARRLIRADGHGVPELLEAILKFFPLDSYVDCPVALMQVVPGDPTKPVIWQQ
jgi:L-fucose mutarotase